MSTRTCCIIYYTLFEKKKKAKWNEAIFILTWDWIFRLDKLCQLTKVLSFICRDFNMSTEHGVLNIIHFMKKEK
jgi:hypothetical protein